MNRLVESQEIEGARPTGQDEALQQIFADVQRQPWLLPKSWAWVPLTAVLAPLQGGRTIHHGWSPQCEKGPATNDEAWGVLKTTAVQHGQFIASENKALPAHLEPRPHLEVRTGDLLLTCAGPRSRCGVACLIRSTRPRLILSGKMYRFRAEPKLVLAGFLEAFLTSSFAWREIDAMKTGGSDSGLNLTHDRFRTLSIPLPPLAEQRRIVAQIDKLFAELANGEAALRAARDGLDTFRRALLKAAVTGALTADWREINRPDETGNDLIARLRTAQAGKERHSKRGRRLAKLSTSNLLPLTNLPDGWTWAMLGELATSGPTNGYSPRKSTDGSGTLSLKLTATTKGVLDLSNRAVKTLSEFVPVSSDLYLSPGDLLFQRGNTIEYVGIAAVFDGPAKTYVYPDLMIRVRTPSRQITEWLWRVANAPGGRQFMSSRATGTAGTMPKISGTTVSEFPVPIPPLAEIIEILRRVSDALAALDDTRTMLDAEAADATRLRQSVLKAAFAGHLVAQDPADEPASLLLARFDADSIASLGPQEQPSSPRRGKPRKISS